MKVYETAADIAAREPTEIVTGEVLYMDGGYNNIMMEAVILPFSQSVSDGSRWRRRGGKTT